MSEKRTIGSYELREVLGEGGFGIVYAAWHKTIQREVAMKVILPLYANQAEFISRFAIEAQLVAKLEHPNIVPLYDFWRDPDGAYLVMRLIRGGSLGDAILQSTLNGEYWELERAAKLLEQIASALHIAHRNKIVHQDIKPANILLDEDGNAYLTDFGIARDMESDVNLAKDENNVMHGSPKYISPEHLKRSEITPKSDIYSLGILMFEVLTGEPPYDSTELLELLQMHLRQTIPPLEEYRPNMPPELNEVLQKATTRKISERYDSVLDFSRDFTTIVRKIKYGGRSDGLGTDAFDTDLGTDDIDNPYKGLAAFQEADVDDFFGREELTKDLLRRVIEHNKPYNRLLAVVGPSGSGKSSVVRAGVIPQIRSGALAGITFYTATMIPGTNPMRALEGAVLRVAARASDDFLKKLSQPDFDLMEVLELSLPATGEMLLIIDQFEEVFTLVDDPTIRENFLQTVHKAITHPESRVRVIITMRADFTGRALQERLWGEMIRARTELIPTMSDEELQAAIEKPAERVGLHLQRGLTDLIIKDVQREVGSLPLLQYTLNELYDRRRGAALTLEAYNALGGISGALAQRAQEIYETLSAEHQLIAQRVLPRLVKLGEGVEDTRRREFLKNLKTLHTDGEAVDAVLMKFQDGHLIARSYDEKDRDIIVEVAHEALIRRWGLLREWLDDNRDALRMQDALRGEVAQWVDAKQSADFLARGDRLAQFRQLLKNNSIALSENERTFLIASDEAAKQAERNRQRRLVILATVAAVAIIFAVAAGFFWQTALAAQAKAEQEAIRANQQSILARSRELAASAGLYRESQPDLAVLLSLQAIETSATFETRNSLLTAIQSHPTLIGYLNGHTDEVRSVVLNPDKTILVSASRNGEIIIWDVASRQIIQSLIGHTGRINNIVFTSDGTVMASTGFDGQVLVWDTATWDLLHTLTWQDGDTVPNGWGLAFASDDTTIAVGDHLGKVITWDIVSGEEIHSFNAHSDAVYALAYQPNGSILATGGGDTKVKLWDTESGNMLQEFDLHQDWVLDLAFRADGRLLASSDADGVIRFWNPENFESLGALTGHENGVRTVLFTPDGRRLISADLDGQIIVNDLSDSANSFAISSPESTQIWSIDLKGNELYIGGNTDSIFIMSLASRPVFPFNHIIGNTGDEINRVAFSTDSVYLAAGGGSSENFAISIWDMNTENVETITEHQNIVTDLAWYNNQLVSVDFDGLVVIWENGETRTFTVDKPILSVATYGNLVAMGDSNGNIDLWDIEASPPERIETLAAHDSLVLGLDFNSDGTQLVSGGRDGTLALWDVETKTQIGETWIGHTDDVLTVAFSPDGRVVASGSRDMTIILWDVATGTMLGNPLMGHTNWVTGLAFQPDGKMLVSASRDSTLRMWDTVAMRQLGLPLTGHTSFIASVDFSADGEWISSGSALGNVFLWNADLDNWITTTCQFANRGLSATEEQAFFSGDFPSVSVCPQES